MSDMAPLTRTLFIPVEQVATAAGDVLKWVSLHIGSGIADPGGTVKLTISRA